jgi:hypothetical protein
MNLWQRFNFCFSQQLLKTVSRGGLFFWQLTIFIAVVLWHSLQILLPNNVYILSFWARVQVVTSVIYTLMAADIQNPEYLDFALIRGPNQ